MRLSGWPRLLLAALVVAAITHLAAVWALPRLIMWRLSSSVPADMERAGAVLLPPMTDHTQRRVVMPSPDLLYALCSFDLSAGPWRIQADPRTPQYWSVALYAANSDNFWVGNDAEAHGRPLDVLLLGPGQAAPGQLSQAGGVPASARLVRSPSDRGLLLMRVLVQDRDKDLAAMDAARCSLRCAPVQP